MITDSNQIKETKATEAPPQLSGYAAHIWLDGEGKGDNGYLINTFPSPVYFQVYHFIEFFRTCQNHLF